MTTSGTNTFTMDVAELIEEAADRIGGDPISGDEAMKARRSLNLLLINLVNMEAPLSTREFRTVVLTPGTNHYVLPSDVVNVLTMFAKDTGDDSTIELTRDDIMEYTRQYRKNISGRPTTFYMDKQNTTLNLTLYPKPDKAYTLQYWATTKIQDVTASTETIELPTIYLPAICSGLAYYMSLKRRGIPTEYRAELKSIFSDELTAVLGEDRTRVSMFIRPASRGNY